MSNENALLKEMVERQLQRLLCQLKDLDELKDELTEEEIRETRTETMEELNEFRVNLDKMIAGDITLVDQLGALRLATMAAINEAFKTPDIIRMFSARQTEELRESLAKLKEKMHLKSISVAQYEEKAMEILTALKSLNEPLSDEEAAFLSKQMQNRFSGFQESSNSVNQAQGKTLISKFGDQSKITDQ
ncbi:protein LZIC-like [Histomonas meleagridis]|uniref:protein LZIC-like n=1 Tax=Histomonas meleagridis TaxID=135588 RepID=UPI00355A6969|nr:protein LZIC-like [Histomonas meleagridis]KAH0799152.1 protein LZIC-like [Histomonas meleagridis]